MNNACCAAWAFIGFFALSLPRPAAAETAEQQAEHDDVPAVGLREPGIKPTAEPSIAAEQARAQAVADAGLALHGLGYLSFVTPLQGNASINLLLLQVELTYDAAQWGVLATPRFRVTSISHDDSQAYLFFQQAYGFWRHPWGEVKAGKLYQRFGRLWDFGFYGPLLANDDVKLQPDFGVAAEGAPELAPHFNLEYAAQYFAADGRALSLRNDRMFSGRNLRRRHIGVARLAPKYSFDERRSIAVGLSGSRYEVATDGHSVRRGAIDVDIAYGPVNAFIEWGRQDGGDWASASGQVSSHTYAWVGAKYNTPWFNLRYHVTAVSYDQNKSLSILQQPGVETDVTENFGLMAELAWWQDTTAFTRRYRERSVYLIATGKF